MGSGARQFGPLIAVCCLWAAFNIPRVGQPFHGWIDSYVSSQIGAHAYNHLKWGLGVTHGANVWAVNYEGKPQIWYSVSPLASWLVALPLAAGVPLQPAVRLVLLLLSLWFLIGFWWFVRNVWGAYAANVAVAVAVVLPVSLQYGIAFGADNKAFGPLFTALALVTSGRRRDGRWLAAFGICGAIAVLFSWLSWLLLLPALGLEWRRGHRRLAVGAALLVVLAPLVVHAVPVLLSGITPATAAEHFAERVGGSQMHTQGRPPLSYPDLVHRLLVWSFTTPSFYGPLAATLGLGTLGAALGAALRGRRFRWPGTFWLLLLAAYALPYNLLARNVATYHESFMVLFVPAIGVCGGIVSAKWREWTGRRDRGGWAWVMPTALLGGLLITATWPGRGAFLPAALDYELRDMALYLGEVMTPETVLVASARAADIPSLEGVPLALQARDRVIPPFITCLTGRTAYVVTDATELTALLALLPSGRPVIVIQNKGDLEPLPGGLARRQFAEYTIVTLSGSRP